MEAGAVVRVGLGVVCPAFPAESPSLLPLVLLKMDIATFLTSILEMESCATYPRVDGGLRVKVPLLHLRDLPLPKVVDEQFDEGLGGVAPVAAVAVFLHGVLQLVPSAHVAVEEAMLAQVVVDATEALVSVF